MALFLILIKEDFTCLAEAQHYINTHKKSWSKAEITAKQDV